MLFAPCWMTLTWREIPISAPEILSDGAGTHGEMERPAQSFQLMTRQITHGSAAVELDGLEETARLRADAHAGRGVGEQHLDVAGAFDRLRLRRRPGSADMTDGSATGKPRPARERPSGVLRRAGLTLHNPSSR